ncbi:MAG TPA: redox-regulated ATPase YchF [Longimicrobiales bacterium]|nr:redox-regulated ATPase YchF [Longimicrobiales bacterium]
MPNLKLGIVGLPNVGKSTLFNALTAAGAAAENYPFCTVDPNVGVVEVPDPRLDLLNEVVQPKARVPAVVTFVDIAGLVEGASQGEGLGNRFLANIREVHAICHVVRCFDDDDVAHVAGSVDPVRDLGIVDTELALADLAAVEKRADRVAKLARSGDRDAKEEAKLLARLEEALGEGRPARDVPINNGAERRWLDELQLLTAKRQLIVANVLEDDLPEADNRHVRALREELAGRGEEAEIVALAAAIEAELQSLDPADRAEYLAELGLEEPGLHRLIRAGYRLLDLISFFTAGPKEVRAWTIRRGSTAPEAAGEIHSDFQRGFIRAETIGWEDFEAIRSEAKARERGLMRSEGKEYVVDDGDVMLFRFNV